MIEIVSSSEAPAALGPYSQAIKTPGLVFCSGQIPLDPKTGSLVEGSIADQTRRSLMNLAAVLEKAGSSLSNVVKTTVFLADMGDFAEMNAAYAEMFGSARPARSCVEVSKLPKGARVEIECIAAV